MRVFVSYSHDSEAHKSRVLALVERLREDGIDCEVDQYEEAPAEGWPAWMARQISEAMYVLTVCTETYYRRVSGQERHGVGLGARWEGALITQSLYDAGGKNEKFIPVVLEADDARFVPDFLRHTTRYEIESEAQYERLYRRLTNQPAVARRPLGSIRQLPAAAGTDAHAEVPRKGGDPAPPSHQGPTMSSQAARAAHVGSARIPALALLRDPTGPSHFLPLVSGRTSEDETTLVVAPADGEARAFLETLANRQFGGGTLDLAYGTTALRGRLLSVERAFSDGKDQCTLVLQDVTEKHARIGEMSTSGLSADDIALMRARRILLNEPLSPMPQPGGWRNHDQSMLDLFVRGMGAALEVDASPLPALRVSLAGEGDAFFLAAARLTAVLWLSLSGTVAHVLDLELRLLTPAVLSVRFRGQRARVYTNSAPAVLEVEGECRLK